MNTWTEDLRQIAGKLIDLHNDCPGRHRHNDSCARCSCLLGVSEILMQQAKTAERMDGIKPVVNQPDPFLPPKVAGAVQLGKH